MTARRQLRAAASLVAVLAGIVPGPVGGARNRADPLDVGDLPLVEVPASSGGTAPLVVLLTGDGGWASIDKQIARTLAEHGVPVVGFTTRAYLYRPRTPAGTAADVARVLRHYMTAWERDRAAIVGYSRGADIAPFIVSRLPAELRSHLSLVAMLGLAQSASFEFHWADLVRDVRRPTDLPVAPELARLRGTRMLCVYGADERDSACSGADSSLGIARYGRAGSHHFGGDYRAIAQLLLSALASDRETPGAE